MLGGWLGFWLCIEQADRETSFEHAQENEISRKPIRKGSYRLAAYFKGGSKAGNLKSKK